MSEPLKENPLDSSNVLLSKVLATVVEVAGMFAHDMNINACIAAGQDVLGGVYDESAYSNNYDYLNGLIDEYEKAQSPSIPWHDAEDDPAICYILGAISTITAKPENTAYYDFIKDYADILKVKGDIDILVIYDAHTAVCRLHDVTNIVGWLINGNIYLMDNYCTAIDWLTNYIDIIYGLDRYPQMMNDR